VEALFAGGFLIFLNIKLNNYSWLYNPAMLTAELVRH